MHLIVCQKPRPDLESAHQARHFGIWHIFQQLREVALLIWMFGPQL